MSKSNKKLKKVNKEELKKVKGGVDVYEIFRGKVLGENTKEPGASPAININKNRVTFGIKIKWS